jgi:hypothetical protein
MYDPFDQVNVYPRIQGGTRVEWTLKSEFGWDSPLEFQLQYSETNNPKADDWTNVGAPVSNIYFIIDPEQRVFNNFNWASYRIRVTTAGNTYYSRPRSSFGVPSRRWWRIGREVIRTELVRLKNDELGTEMLVLKRRTRGQRCTVCVDPLTQEVTSSDCESCWGTGWLGGYYDPVECIWADFIEPPMQNDLDGGEARGTVDDSRRTTARIINIPFLFTGDILVEKYRDNRWFVKNYKPEVVIANTPLIVNVELRLLEYTNAAYKIPLDVNGDNLDFAEELRHSDHPLANKCRDGYVKTEKSECQNPQM